MVLAHHGRTAPMAHLRVLSGTTASGADMSGLARAAEALGFEAIAAELDYEDLIAPDLWPAILHWDGDHFVVLTEATAARAVVLDPAFGERRLGRAEFESHRVGAGRSRGGLLVLPEDSVSIDAEASTSFDEPTSQPAPSPESSTDPAPGAPFNILGFGGRDLPRYYRLYGVTALYAGLLAAGLYVLARALQLAVDLQYREGWVQEVSALLAVAAAVLLGQHLVRRAGLAVAQEAGDRDVAGLSRFVASASQSLQPEAVLRLVEDIDAVKMFRAYHLATFTLAAVGIALAVLFAVSTDALLGICLLFVLAALGALIVLYSEVSRETQARAVEAQVGQREALHERVAAGAELARLGMSDEWLVSRLASRNRSAAAAFSKVATEFVARADLARLATAIGTLIFLSLGLYRLGYGGLQVGPLLFLALTYWLGLSRLWAFAKTYRHFRATAAARARLEELRQTPPQTRSTRPSAWPATLHLVWQSPRGQTQRISFPTEASLGLVGGDDLTRAALVSACLGLENDRGAVMSTSADGLNVTRLQDYSRVAVIGTEGGLMSGTVASNITLSARTDLDDLQRAADTAGLDEVALAAGFSTPIPFAGTGVDTHLRTRILLARAFYHGADTIVLDGGTDGLSAYDEAYIIDTLAALPETRLFVCNARRPSATVSLDLLIQLEEGEVESFGTHDELLAGGGAYAIQYTDQNVLAA